MCVLIVIIFLFIRHFLCKKVIGLQIAYLSRFSFLFIPFPEIGFSLSSSSYFFFDSPDLLAMPFIPGAVLTTEHIYKFIMDGPRVFALHDGSSECAISGFKHIRVCDPRLYTNLFLSSLQELRNIQLLSHQSAGAQLFRPCLEFAQMILSRFFRQFLFTVLGLLVIK
jgi:hypothetical protein